MLKKIYTWGGSLIAIFGFLFLLKRVNLYCNQINFTEKFFQKLIRLLSYTGKSRIHTIVWKLYWKIIKLYCLQSTRQVIEY
jgi:hypothetical protein